MEIPYTGSKSDKIPYYTLHLRYGLRRDDQETDRGPLPVEYTAMLFNFIQQKIDQYHQSRQSKNQNIITMIASIIAAIAAIIAAIFTPK